MSSTSISMVEGKLPAGFRFHPRDEELICDYLMNKVVSHHADDDEYHSNLLIQVDLNKSEPWELPESACVGGKEWYFYSQRDRKYATGLRTNRATSSGYWKATGKDRPVLSSNSKAIVGMRKTLVFYQGRAPKGTKTDWVMHEFRLEGPLAPPISSSLKEDWVLCRVFYKSREMGISNTASLPALMDDHHQLHLQVPCLSNNIHLSPKHDLFFEPKASPSPSPAGGTPNTLGHTHSAIITIDPFCGSDTDNEVLKALLNQLNNMESNPNLESLGDPTSQAYLSQFGMPNIWTHY